MKMQQFEESGQAFFRGWLWLASRGSEGRRYWFVGVRLPGRATEHVEQREERETPKCIRCDAPAVGICIVCKNFFCGPTGCLTQAIYHPMKLTPKENQ